MIDCPSTATLRKYGITQEEFATILELQGGVCPICGKTPSPSRKTGKRRWVIDHLHVKGWKNMPPEKRKTYIRGITDWFCNRNFLAKGITVEKAQNIVTYLKAYQGRTTK